MIEALGALHETNAVSRVVAALRKLSPTFHPLIRLGFRANAKLHFLG